MSTLLERDRSAPERPAGAGRSAWFGAFLRRLHFYAGIFVGPFIFIAAVTGALYAISPQVERVVYADALSVPVTSTPLPLADQIEAANAYVGPSETLTAVRPAPGPGDTTRVHYAGEGLTESESRAIFVDPGTAEVLDDLTVYGTSGALPIRGWIDQFHRGLHLGDAGRLYSELAASWLWVIAVAGLILWVLRRRRTNRANRNHAGTNTTRTNRTGTRTKGYRRTLSRHTTLGVCVAVGMLFLSATGITWSQNAGANVTNLRGALNWSTPTVSTSLDPEAAAESGEHDHAAPAPETAEGAAPDPTTFAAVLAVAQEVNVNTGLVEIQPPADDQSAWVVQEIQRSYPTEVDAVAVNGATGMVTDRVDFADYPLAAQFARWGIDLHMGSMFGLPNQIVLFVLASGIATMVVWGYTMWWQRRPRHDPSRRFGVRPPRGTLQRAPTWGVTLMVVVALAVGWFLPMLGLSLIAFVALDLLLEWRAERRTIKNV